MKVSVLMAALASVVVMGLAGGPQAHAEPFEDANGAFAAGRYAESARGYEALLKKDGYSVAVLFNLGNAHLRLGQTGDAILDYERAKWLAPHDADVSANLQFAQKHAGLGTPPDFWTDALASYLSPNGWAWLASGTLFLLCAGILAAQWGGKHRQILRLSSAATAAIFIAACFAMAVRYRQLDRAVLPAKVTRAFISPFNGAKVAVEFSAGQVVTVESSHGDFAFVRDQAGHSGWVSKAQVALVVAG